jgi:aryl-alcohol dehydrogenase-like predicted oxidoreductase
MRGSGNLCAGFHYTCHLFANLCAGYMERYNKSLAREAVAEYVKVAEKHGLTPSELALAWCNQRWCVTSTIIGATSMEQLKVASTLPQALLYRRIKVI